MVNNNNKALILAKYAVMFAIIFVAMMIDKAISIIPIPFSMAACVLLVTLSFCFLQNSWTVALLSGLFFGLASLLKEFILPNPAGIVGAFPPIYWPFITIIPRVIMAAIAFGIYRMMLFFTGKMTNARRRQFVCLTVAALFGLLSNTLGFFSAVEISRAIHGEANQGVFAMMYACLVTNIIPEYVISLVGVPFIVLGVRRGLKLGTDGNNLKKLYKAENSPALDGGAEAAQNAVGNDAPRTDDVQTDSVSETANDLEENK